MVKQKRREVQRAYVLPLRPDVTACIAEQVPMRLVDGLRQPRRARAVQDDDAAVRLADVVARSRREQRSTAARSSRMVTRTDAGGAGAGAGAGKEAELAAPSWMPRACTQKRASGLARALYSMSSGMVRMGAWDSGCRRSR